ncbi:hypothetical protein [Acrocarpospora catenulata]|nr:hypothetical protein [Acrocarpospora catenulata]
MRRLAAAATLFTVLSVALTGVASAEASDRVPPPSESIENFHWT